MVRKGSSYLRTPVAVGRLSKAVSWPNFDLATIVDAEVDVLVKDRVTVGVHVFGGQAETGDVISWAELHNLSQYLSRV